MRLLLVMSTALLVGAGGCTERRAETPPEPITIAAATIPNFSLVHLAQAKGYFAEEGLAVTLQLHRFGKPALESLLAGKADLATCAETPLVLAELRGEPLSVLASLATSTRNNAVVARKDAGISRPSDLAGKRIGVTLGTSGDFFLDTFLLRHGLDRKLVRFLDLKPEEMGAALERSEVDAVATWNPTAARLLRLMGGRAAAFYAEDIYTETAVLVSRREFARQRPEPARRVLRALIRAEAFFRDRPDEARKAMATALGDDDGTLDASLRQFDFRVRLDQGLLVLLEEEARWAKRIGRGSNRDSPNFLETLDPVPLQAVKPDAVGLIR
jgi:ABC-type nitrate/sulfonate/bicarbonate transport system substrate-binding protein